MNLNNQYDKLFLNHIRFLRKYKVIGFGLGIMSLKIAIEIAIANEIHFH